MKRVIVSVTNDLFTDQRVDKICATLLDLNFEVLLVGRMLSRSKIIERFYKTRRFRLWFNSGLLFYANYNIRLFFFLMFNKVDYLWSNDLDTLPANYFVSKLRNKQLIFDSHEYFTEVPELINRPIVKGFWKLIERSIVPNLKQVLTVSSSIVDMYKKEYDIHPQLLRNLPYKCKVFVEVANIKHKEKKILIYQGSVNINRGIEYMVEAMCYIDNAILYIIGFGDIFDQIYHKIKVLNLEKRVKMLGEISLTKLHGYTSQADLGLSLEEDIGLNYRFSLPNKLFNYIQEGLPVLVSPLPEMRKIVSSYDIGEVIDKHDGEHIAKKIKLMINNPDAMRVWSLNSRKAALELNWEEEKHIIKDLF